MQFTSHIIWLASGERWFGVLEREGVIEDVLLFPDEGLVPLYLRDPWNAVFEPLLCDGYERLLQTVLALHDLKDGTTVHSLRLPRNALSCQPVKRPAWLDEPTKS